MLVDTEIDRVVEYYAQHSATVGLQPRANVFLETDFIVRNDNRDEDGGIGEENLAPRNESHVRLNSNVANVYNGDAGDYSIREVRHNQQGVGNNDSGDHGDGHNNSDGNTGNNGDQSGGNREDNSEVNNENHASGSNNDNSNNDNNDKKNNGSNLKDNDEEGADVDVDDEENTEDEDINKIDKFDDGTNSSIKTYLVNKLPFSSEDFNKEDTKLVVTSTSSILSNTPYDSIEASHKLNVPNEIYHSNRINFRMKSTSSDFVELINIKGNSLSDEFSGTESMEYIHEVENEKSSEEFENRYTNLITITQGAVDEDINRDETDVSYNKHLTTANIDSSEVHVITGNDTLSAVICLEEGLADDDSWVEELDRDDFAAEESSESEDFSSFIEQEEVRRFNRCDIDFTLHTIVEESGEDSDIEEKENTTTQLEKYFFFEIGGTNMNNANEDDDTISSSNNGGADLDSISESSSTISESIDMVKVSQTPTKSEKNPTSGDLAPSRLEKYFLSGFMGFNKRDSDGSVGSDSEGKHSPEQRRKKLVRARGTARHSSQDNLNEEQQTNSASLSESSDSDAVDTNEDHSSFEKSDGQFDTVKRMKKKKRSVGVSSIEHLESCCENFSDSKKFETENGQHEVSNSTQAEDIPISASKDLNSISVAKDAVLVQSINCVAPTKNEKSKNLLAPVVNNNLSRKDSFNNWSSDEETNLMMSKMRSFFKSMIANQRSKNASPVIKNRNKLPQLVYFEAELTRLMKTVPGIRDDQVKEIVEYLSSEDTWSDSYDSSDYTSSDLEIGSKKGPFGENISVEHCKVPDMCTDGSKTDSDLVYRCLMSSFQQHSAVDGAGVSSDSSTSHCSPPLMNKVMQHIGSRLVALMHEVTEGSAGAIVGAGAGPKAGGRYHRRMQPKLPTICTTTEEEDDSLEECSPLPRSKSYDPLLEESRQECSDNERFSWRGSFESALMTGSDSRTRLPSAGEASASALALAAAKRRSAGDLLFKSGNSREHLDRVRSCGSIGGGVEDKIWSLRHPRKRRSSVPEAASNSGGESADGENDSDDEEVELRPHTSSEEKMSASGENLAKSTTLPRMLQTLNISATNSLPRLSSSVSPATNIYKVNNSHQFGVKSARYRPPGYNSRMNPGSYATLCAPPRRDYNRRRLANQEIPSPSISVLSVGTGDNCSVASDISDRTGILDNEFEKSPSRVSTVTVTRSDSMASVYSGAGEGRYGIVPIRGEVEFSLQYNYKTGDVEIHIKRCSDLAPVDVKRNRSDPYVKVYLLPDKSKSGKRKTRVKKHTLNPIFDEILKYHVTLEELKSRTLWLSVWHSDIFGRNDFLGEVIIPLENKVFDDPLPKLYVLKERSEVPESVSTFKGDVIVALKFVLPLENKLKNRTTKELGSLHVLVKEAKNLTAIKSSGTSDPFCKSYLLPNKGRSCKQKTPVLKRTCNPIWNHTFVYNNVTLDEMSQRCLELTIWDHDRLASNEFLGGVRLSLGTGLYNDKSVDWMDSNNREIALWQRMINHPNFWVESSLILRPSLDMRSKN